MAISAGHIASFFMGFKELGLGLRLRLVEDSPFTRECDGMHGVALGALLLLLWGPLFGLGLQVSIPERVCISQSEGLMMCAGV